MKQLLVIGTAAFFAGPAAAQEAVAAMGTEAETEMSAEVEAAAEEEVMAEEDAAPELAVLNAKDVSLDEFQWLKRPIVVFADTEADPRFQEQMALLLSRPADLLERDVVIIVDTEPSPRSDIRTKLRPRGFMMTLIGKDGGVKLRKPFPWNVREISRSIDKMPVRQQEIRDRKAAAAAEG